MQLLYKNDDGTYEMLDKDGYKEKVAECFKEYVTDDNVVVIKDNKVHSILKKGNYKPSDYDIFKNYDAESDLWWLDEIFTFSDMVEDNLDMYKKIELAHEESKKKTSRQLRKKI